MLFAFKINGIINIVLTTTKMNGVWEMKRGFEIVSKYQGEDLTLPVRATQNAAGYDFCAAKDRKSVV